MSDPCPWLGEIDRCFFDPFGQGRIAPGRRVLRSEGGVLDRIIFPLVAGLVLAGVANPSRAVDLGPEFAGAESDRLAIEKTLGIGAVGAVIAAPNIEDPATYLALTPANRVYRFLAGPYRGKEESVRCFPVKESPGVTTWHYELGGGEVGFLESEADGDVVLAGIQDPRERVWTQYAPPEPVLLNGLAAGDERKFRMLVRVSDIQQPDQWTHEGWLDVVYRYVGAYRMNVPAGTFETVLIKTTFSGEIGPATVHDTQYRFFARGTGLVAAVEQRDVTAFLIYRPHTEIAKVLVAPN